MNPAEAILVAAGIGALCMVVWWVLERWLPAPRRSPRLPQHPHSAFDDIAERPNGAWIALPGNRIELGASGFAITLHTALTGPLYSLWAPEGRLIASGFDLAQCKALGERLAAEREEFVCTERPELPRFHH